MLNAVPKMIKHVFYLEINILFREVTCTNSDGKSDDLKVLFWLFARFITMWYPFVWLFCKVRGNPYLSASDLTYSVTNWKMVNVK